MCSDERLGESPEGFPTQRAALEREDQLRWMGGFSSRASLLLSIVRFPGPSLAYDVVCGLRAR